MAGPREGHSPSIYSQKLWEAKAGVPVTVSTLPSSGQGAYGAVAAYIPGGPSHLSQTSLLSEEHLLLHQKANQMIHPAGNFMTIDSSKGHRRTSPRHLHTHIFIAVASVPARHVTNGWNAEKDGIRIIPCLDNIYTYLQSSIVQPLKK